MTQVFGQRAEQQALDYLTRQGLKLVARNYSCRLGEIDLIMKDKTHLIFIEVRARKGTDFGGGLASITYAKRQKIIKTTSHYLLTQNIKDQEAIRFDVVSIDGESEQLTWIKDAFNVDY
jgi:putative endonuclease